MTRNILKLVVILACASSTPSWADDVKPTAPPESSGEGAKAIAEAATVAEVESSGLPVVSYQSQHATIMKDCGVDTTNGKQLLSVLQSWDEATKTIFASVYKNHPELVEKLASVEKDLAAATEANNADMVQDLTRQRNALADLMGGWNPESRKQLEDADTKYRGSVRELVSADKYDRLDEILETAQDTQLNRPRRGPVRSPRALKAIVDRLGDLTPEQRRSVDNVFLQFRESQRANRGRSADTSTQERKLYDDVFAVLTSGQKTRVEQQLAGRATDAAPKEPATPDAAATPAVPEAPKNPLTPAAAPTNGAAKKP